MTADSQTGAGAPDGGTATPAAAAPASATTATAGASTPTPASPLLASSPVNATPMRGTPGLEHSERHTGSDKRMLPLMLGALGVVFGDIGTSPLYTLRECIRFLAPQTPAELRGDVL